MSPLTFRIREPRESRGWSQGQLADKAGVRQATISDLETGRIRRVQLDLLERIGAALSVDAASLLVSSSRAEGEVPQIAPHAVTVNIILQ